MPFTRSACAKSVLTVASLVAPLTACQRPATLHHAAPSDWIPAGPIRPAAGYGSGSHDHSGLNDAELAVVKRATATYRDFAAAQKAGYTTAVTQCWQNQPLGAMGWHYGNTSLFDAKVEANRPEILLYEKDARGAFQLVGVEWIIPFEKWTSDAPPELLGQKLMRNLTFNVWALHAWIWKTNPKGVFADWNPDVRC